MHLSDPLLTSADVRAATGLSKSELYRRIRCGAFPEPIKLGHRTVRWRLSEVEDWVAACPRATGREDRAVA